MSKSKRFAPAKMVRAEHRYAFAAERFGRWYIFGHPISENILGRGPSRMAAWRDAASRL